MDTRLSRQGRRLAVLLISLWAADASAGMTVTLDSVTPFESNFDYRYSVTLPTTTDLMQGSNQPPCCYFTLYDIPGLITVEAYGDWQGSGGITPSGLTPSDDPTLSNVSFTWRGSSFSGPTTVYAGLVRSSYGSVALGTYAWQNFGQDPYYPDSRISFSALGQVGIPSISGSGGGGGDGTGQVSEPSTGWLLLGSIALMLAVNRRQLHSNGRRSFKRLPAARPASPKWT